MWLGTCWKEGRHRTPIAAVAVSPPQFECFVLCTRTLAFFGSFLQCGRAYKLVLGMTGYGSYLFIRDEATFEKTSEQDRASTA